MIPTALVQFSSPKLTPTEIEKLLAFRETHRALKDRLEAIDKAIKSTEADILAKIDSGADTSACGHHVYVQSTERRFPAWKEHFITFMGKAKADAILEGTTPEIYRKVLIK